MIRPLDYSYDALVVAKSPRILIADDESQLLRVLVRVLEKQGYTVISAQEGKAAVEALRKAPEAIDAIVIDAAIDPEGAGPVLEVVAEEQPQIGVIVTSGDQLPGPLRSRLLANNGIFLLKPFLPNALIEAVEDSIVKGVAE
jgi:two-component system cell cycle sensor histidine kinase/response regulator CckA